MTLTDPLPRLDPPAGTVPGAGPGAGPGAAAPCAVAPEEMLARADAASNFLKALAHEGRLMILCYLSTGEKSVTELELLLASRQAAVSQQLARLRLEGLVSARRDGKAIFYSLADDRARRLVATLYDLFCRDGEG